MKFQIFLSLTSVFIIFLNFIFLFKHSVLASSQFIENFSEDKNGEFPSQWVLGSNDCQFNGNPSKWIVQNGRVNIKSSNNCSTDIYPNDKAWGLIGNNYIVEFDMDIVSGTDHNFIIKKNGNDWSNWNELHIASPDLLTLDTVNPIVSYNGNFPIGSTQHFKIKVIDNKIIVFLNNSASPIIDTIDSKPSFDGRISLAARPAGDLNETNFSNIVVTSIDDVPTPTPTPTPTPMPLPVPLFKQTDPRWKNNVYDGANNWFSSDPTINRWGCAMTSAAMVLKYYGINKLPDGTPLDPGSLNIWLKNNNGFDDEILSGYMIPNAITQLSKLAKGINRTSFDMLEASVNPHMDKNQLTNDLKSQQPDILGVTGNGHYIVADGISGNSYLINDPYFSKTLLSDYNNTFASITRYTPSASDGSYIMAIGTNNIFYDIKDENGKIIGTQFTQNPIVDPIEGKSSSKPALNDFFPKPISGKYIITISDRGSSPQSYKLDLYLYDKNANLVTKKIQGSVTSGNPDTIQIDFDHNIVKNISADRIVTFESMLQDITEAKNLGTINNAAANVLSLYIKKGQRDVIHWKKFVKLDLDLALLYLKIHNGHNISATGYKVLTYDGNYLKSHL